jgi:hypothetical protein
MKKASFFVTSVVIFIMSMGILHAATVTVPPVDSSNFTSPRDNTYFPMSAIGKTYVYEAETKDELVRSEITFTTNTINILGITCIVVHDVERIYIPDLDKWVITEDTFDWFAWDNNGNVWYFGEDTEACLAFDEEWNCTETTTEGSWTAGVDGAEAGIIMLADPMPGISYRQEYYENVAEDMGKVLRLNARVSVQYGDFADCLQTKEWTPLSPGAIEHKYYAPGVGLVFVQEHKGKIVKVELIDIY